MIVLNGYKSHLSAEFQIFYKNYNIITLCLFTHFLHLIQPLDIGCFKILKQMYNKEFEFFIWIKIDYIIKIEFFFAFYTVYNNAIILANVLKRFRDIRLVPFDLQVVISKVDIKLQILTSIGLPFLKAESWVSQTLYIIAESFSQYIYM